ncbi:hypothetical protein W822_08035 [Advenella kashmirensis W13003]|uniref:Uncharacterized protein n=1 Tax=Advenella kashmirensis W13003 TaxID=1424334 RepID=V8QUZ8_9BURK|nr:immunity 22 family protein [Advenella kashmirensis]ETF03467.1 hypothetical protein W822_08035 [Advenella kashmirensis W13003]
MLEFIDRYADERFQNNKRLKVASIWIGTIANEQSLIDYIAADDPESGHFARDMGEDWFDHDFIAVEHQKAPEPLEQVVERLAQTLGCPDEMKQEILRRCQNGGIRQANTTVCLMQHVYRGNDAQDFHGMVFAGSYEYEEPAQQPVSKYDHLFAGVTTAAALPDLREYVTSGAFADESGLISDDIQYYGYKLRDAVQLPVAEFFDLPIVKQRLVLADSAQAVYEACRKAGLESINAFISAGTQAPTPLNIDEDKTVCGLHYVGTFKTQYPE